MENSKSEVEIIDKYMIFWKACLGRGTQGLVYKGSYLPEYKPAWFPQDEFLAIKIVDLPSERQLEEDENQQKDLLLLKDEIKTLMNLSHQNIIHLFDVKKKGNHLYIIMEYCNQGNLSEFVKRNDLSDDEIIYYFSQIINAFKYIHSKNIIHRDIKPENIMLKDLVIKVGDFGFAKTVGEQEKQQDYIGTQCTMAPQVLIGDVGYTHKADIYSLGCTFYFMFYAKFPYAQKAKNYMQLIEVLQQRQPPEFPPKDSMELKEEVKQLITSMLEFDEQNRINWEQLFSNPLLKIKDEELEQMNLIRFNAPQMKIDFDIEEFQFNCKQLVEEPELLRYQTLGQKTLDHLNSKYQSDEIALQVTNIVTFKRGFAVFIRRTFRKLERFFDKTLQNKQSFGKLKIPDEFKEIIKFIISKFELYFLYQLKSSLEAHDDQLLNDHQKWLAFQQHQQYQNLLNGITYDYKIAEIKIFQDCDLEIQKLRNNDNANFNYSSQFYEFLNKNYFDNNIAQIQINEFTEFLTKLILDFVGYFEPIILKFKLQDQLCLENYEYKEAMHMLDDLLILANIEHVFLRKFNEKPFNFNKFFENREKHFNDPLKFDQLIERIITIFDNFVKNKQDFL